MNYWSQFIKLKIAVGGNREAYHYEESFGQPMEEQNHITPVPKHIKRILSQMEFAIRLNEVNDNAFDGCVGQALDRLTAAMEADGTLTRSVCLEAEQLLLPCQAAAKEYKLILYFLGYGNIANRLNKNIVFYNILYFVTL